MNTNSGGGKSSSNVGKDNQPGAGIGQWFRSLGGKFGLRRRSLRETLEFALKDDSQAKAAFSVQEREMLIRLLRFGSSRVEDIMVPRADIIAVDETDLLRDIISTFKDAGVSRVPLYRETLDNPLGMVHIKDLFSWLLTNGAGSPIPNEAGKQEKATSAKRHNEGLNLGEIDLDRPISTVNLRRPVLYVPPSMPAMNLLIRMQSIRIHMALVVDEYGGTDGLVTIEDLVEQIVGDIEDEHDEAEEAHIAIDKKLGLIASGRTPVEDLEKHLGMKIPTEEEDEEIDTLGGLVFTIVGRVPARGELVRHSSGLEFEVLDADPRRVKMLRIHMPKTVKETTPASVEPKKLSSRT